MIINLIINNFLECLGRDWGGGEILNLSYKLKQMLYERRLEMKYADGVIDSMNFQMILQSSLIFSVKISVIYCYLSY